jgi:hypothetical protein
MAESRQDMCCSSSSLSSAIKDEEAFDLTKRQTKERFGNVVTSDDVDKFIDDNIPAKTKKQTDWAFSVYHQWCAVRKEPLSLAEMPVEIMEEQLCRFIVEARREDGGEYPPKTLYALVAGLQRFVRSKGRRDISFLSNEDLNFTRLRLTLDAKMKNLTSMGVGCISKQAEPISEVNEQRLWDKGILTVDTSEGLLYVVFFYNCKLFGLRGGDEHRNLMREQFIIASDHGGQYLRFMGRASKNVQGGLAQKSISVKDLKIYAKSHESKRCIVRIYNSYFGFIPDTGHSTVNL